MTLAESVWEPATMAAPALSSPLFCSAAVVVGVPTPYDFKADRKQERCAFENHTKTSDLQFGKFLMEPVSNFSICYWFF